VIRIAIEDADVDVIDQDQEPNEEDEDQHHVHWHQRQHNDAIDNMFDELNEHYLEEQVRRMSNNVDNNNNGNAQQEAYAAMAERIINSADAEIMLYREEPSFPLQDAEGKFSCPLKWWYASSIKSSWLDEQCR
jgi:hypothetical protein